MRLATAAILLVAAFGAGVALYRLFEGGRATTAKVLDPAEIVAEHQPGLLKSAVPDTLPDFTLKDLDGRPHSMREWEGRPLIVNFWATWCGPCREEIPLLQRLRHERRADGVEVVGIAVDLADDVRAFVAKTMIEYPVLVGEDDGIRAAAAFGVQNLALPFSVFIDHRGRILVLRMGQLHEDQAKLILDTLRDVDSGALEIEVAKARVAAGLRSQAG
jgi:thiol-disulfide isomerase/thioredoxin